jgi:hypothetical protein
VPTDDGDRVVQVLRVQKAQFLHFSSNEQ